MTLFRRGFLAGLVLVGVAWVTTVRPSTASADKPEIYPLSKVKRGLKGYGMTTFQGTTPERFEFEVVGVARNFLPELDIILVKSDDPKLAVSGFWQGMSGSPLYIDGKLACAFSYGFRFNKVPLGGCTPVESMIAEGATPLRGSAQSGVQNVQKKSTKGNKKKGKKSAAVKSGTLPTQVASLADWQRLTPSSSLGEAFDNLSAPRTSWLLSTPLPPAPNKSGTGGGDDDETMSATLPLSIAGFQKDAYGQIEQLFGGYGLEPVRAGGTGGPSEDGPTGFTMGGSIAVQLIKGDMSAAATGTVSYIDGDTVLAFGHPMFQTGETYAPVATSEVLGVVPSAMSAFVLAQPINEAGALVQDRQSMIKADTSLRHPMIPVDIYITSGEKGSDKHEFHVHIWNNKFFAGGLAGAAVFNAITLYLPDRDHATAKIESTLKVAGAKPFHFTDYLYANDGAGSLVGGARGLRAIVPLLLNPWTAVSIESLELKVDLTFDANYGDIKELRLPKTRLEPGKKYTVDVVLESYGKEEIVDTVPFEVPVALAGQIVTLEVVPGDAARLDAAPATDLKSLYAAIRKLLPGNVYAVSLYGADDGVAVDGVAVRDLPASAQDKLHPQTTTQRAEAYKPIYRTTSPAKRVINGGASLMVRIDDVDR
jgi:hypothetical protein